ncbi:MAG: ATP-dependent Clp protease ATP-binding subunit, partial [Oscillospiraceae bacterium]|nr:ATP-dependent Clp protease ATP-binding subunit [Oscillospiraceae bacterium]
SNAGSNDKTASVGFNKTEGEVSKEKAMKALSQLLRPEFLGRVDEVVVFKPLTQENYVDIAGLMLEEMRDPLSEKGIKFNYTHAALETIAKKSYGGKFGGRDIRTTIRNNIEDKLADILIEAGEAGIATLSVDSENDELIIDHS